MQSLIRLLKFAGKLLCVPAAIFVAFVALGWTPWWLALGIGVGLLVLVCGIAVALAMKSGG